MDWDRPRDLESVFAIPMAGATLHTVNLRLAPEQILASILHAWDDAALCQEDFLPVAAAAVPDRERAEADPSGRPA
jgi:fatty-acyl-CoA synthase